MARADGHAHADFFGALGYRHEHDVHHADAAHHQRNQGDARNQKRHGAGGALDGLLDAVGVAHEEVFRAVARNQQIFQAFFGHLRADIVFHFHGNRADVALAGDLLHHRGVRRPHLQLVAAAKAAGVGFGDADHIERALVKQNGFAQRVGAGGEKLLLRVVVNHHHLGALGHIGAVIKAPGFELDAAHIEILRTGAVELGGKVGVAVGERTVARGERRGAFHIALPSDYIGIIHRERFDAAGAPVAKAFARINADGVGAHRIDVGQNLFLRTAPQRHHRHHRSDADNDAEHGEQRAHFVRQNRLHRHAERFHKLVFVKRPRNLLLNAFYFAGANFGVFAAVGNDFAIADFNHAVGVGGNARIVRHQNHGVPLRVQIVNNLHHIGAAFGVERAGGLVGQNDFTAVHQRAGDAHALLLAA